MKDLSTKSPEFYVQLRRPTPTIGFDAYWRFASERHRIYESRVRGDRYPWTTDPVLVGNKFTNAFRASDRVSQYLIKKVQYDADYDFRTLFFRTLLFKIFNRIDTWEAISKSLDVHDVDHFDWTACDELLHKAIDSGTRIYSAAYIMPSGGRNPQYSRKHSMHLGLLKEMLDSDLPKKIESATGMKEAYDVILGCPTFGPFLAYQYLTDLNYCSKLDFDEMSFVAAGPGARDGIKKCFSDLGDFSETDIIRYCVDQQESQFELRNLKAITLFGRRLQLIDCQNLFCEVDKYCRVVHPELGGYTKRARIKQKFRPAGELESPWFPPKWGLNEHLLTLVNSQPSQKKPA